MASKWDPEVSDRLDTVCDLLEVRGRMRWRPSHGDAVDFLSSYFEHCIDQTHVGRPKAAHNFASKWMGRREAENG